MSKSTNEPSPFDYESLQPGYYDTVYSKLKGAQSKWHHLKFEYVSHRMGEFRDHLDIGCGPGTFIGHYCKGRKSIGVDVSSEQIQFAQKKYITDDHSFFHLNETQTLPFDDAHFDCITIIELIEHLEDEMLKKLFNEIKRVLRPGGRLVLTTPNYASLWPILEACVNRSTPVSYKEQHVTHFTKTKLQQLLENQNFNNIWITAFQGMAPFVAPLHWSLASHLAVFENKTWGSLWGHLLFAVAEK